ncbi:hypothetical protein F4805DRAFT_246882 [Annulohypoxylon moriforme]|nr:hypothetical protein F4805DRAFT_246882 [Annulohypoxylon moriforme]
MTSNLLCKRSVICRSFHQSILPPALTTVSYPSKALYRRDQPGYTAYSNPSKLERRYIPCIFNDTQNFTTARALNMASDGDYMAFLDKANEDPSKGYTKAQSSNKQGFKATDDGAQIPAAIQEATKDSFYVSDADEPFVPVYLAWNEGGKGLPDEEEFATLIHHPEPANAQIEILDPADWDTQGQYKAILDAVQKAGKGNDIRVYRVSKGGVKVEYWVVTTEGKGASAKLVGAKALAVES